MTALRPFKARFHGQMQIPRLPDLGRHGAALDPGERRWRPSPKRIPVAHVFVARNRVQKRLQEEIRIMKEGGA